MRPIRVLVVERDMRDDPGQNTPPLRGTTMHIHASIRPVRIAIALALLAVGLGLSMWPLIVATTV